MNRQAKKKLIDTVPFWQHSFDCGDGISVKGAISREALTKKLNNMALPDITGKTVLDVGAFDGYFSFKAEELGARRVVALDHYVWNMHLDRLQEYWQGCRDSNVIPGPYSRVPGVWEPSKLPGKIGFDVIHKIKNSNVEQLVGDFMKIDPIEVGMFDVVFFLGVLYHLESPFQALKRLSLFTRELAVIETAAVYLEGYENLGLFEFYEGGELNSDVSNWFAPNFLGLQKACRAAGFREVMAASPYPPEELDNSNHSEPLRYRLTVHAVK